MTIVYSSALTGNELRSHKETQGTLNAYYNLKKGHLPKLSVIIPPVRYSGNNA